MMTPPMSDVGHIAFSASLVFLVSRSEASQRKRKRIEEKTWALLLEKPGSDWTGSRDGREGGPSSARCSIR